MRLILLLLLMPVMLHAEVIQERIIGGQPVEFGEWLGTVALVLNSPVVTDDYAYYNQFCAGTHIAEGWILTAAHCMIDDKFKVFAGNNDLREPGQLVDVAQVFKHPDYTENHFKNDIALVKLAEPLVDIPIVGIHTTDPLPGDSMDIVGWGATQYSPYSGSTDFPAIMQHAVVSIASRDACNDAYGHIDDTQICAAAPGKDSCQGDSGGPAYINGEIVGVVSYGQGCAVEGYAGVYTRVAAHYRWITQTMRGNGGAVSPLLLLLAAALGIGSIIYSSFTALVDYDHRNNPDRS